MIRKLLFLLPFVLIAHAVEAQCQVDAYGRKVCPAPATVRAPAVTYYAQPVATRAVAYAGGDVYSFGAWLNGVRRQYGRGPVAYDAGLCRDAAINSSRGFGHTYFGNSTRQNVGMGALGSVQSMWLASPPHCAAIFDAGITRYGIACVNGVWTYSAR